MRTRLPLLASRSSYSKSALLASAGWCVAILLLLLTPGRVAAMSASPWPFEEIQPDGSRAVLYVRGDEHFQWLCDARGYTVLRQNGWFHYAARDGFGQLQPTGLRVGTHDPALNGLSPHLLPSRRFQALSPVGGATGSPSASTTASPSPAFSGAFPNLVVLLRFANHAARAVPPEEDLDILMNAAGGHPTLAPTGSVRDAFLQNSYGQLTLDSTVVYWITLPESEAYYANAARGLSTRTHEALRHALNVLDADPNFSFQPFDHDADGQIDAITFLHSGYGAEWGGTSADGAYYMDRIWSHKWSISGGWVGSEGIRVTSYHISPAIWGTSGSAIGRIGVICHETGHFLGLPDLYDGDDSDGDGRVGQGLGSYCLMANSWGFDGSQKYPPHMSGWCKIQLGWASPQSITATGQYLLRQWTQHPDVARIDSGFPSGEYLLVENRQRTGLDAAMPQGGLAIYHVDDLAGTTSEGHPWQTGWPANGRHYRVSLLQADGLYELERGLDRGDAGDVFRGGAVSSLGPNLNGTTYPNTDSYRSGTVTQTGVRLFNISAPGATMSFDYERVASPVPPTAPSSLTATATGPDAITLAWLDTSDQETGFTLQRSTDGSNFVTIRQLAAGVTTAADSGLNASTTYFYRVSAFNDLGASAYSAVASAKTWQAPPAAPTDLTATALPGAKASITWRDLATNESGYRLQRAADATFASELKTISLRSNTAKYSDSKLTPGKTYYYRVQAYNAAGASAFSNTQFITAR